jgi:hypothetical protein
MLKALKIGLVLVIIGIVATVAGFLISGDSVVSSFSEQNYEKVEESFEVGTIVKIDVEMDNRKIVIGESLTGKIEVVYYESEYDRIDSLAEGTTLSLDNTKDWYLNFMWWGNWFNWNNEKFIVYIDIPSGTVFDLVLDSDNGDLVISGLDNLDSLDLDTENGDVELSSLTLTGDILADTENGNIELEDLVFLDAELSTTNGRVILTNVKAGSVDAQGVNGDMIFTDVTTTGSLVLDTVNGGIDIVRGTIALFPGSGTPREVALSCSTENGSIDIGVYGSYEDYYCDFQSVTGSVRVDGENEGEGSHHESQHSAISLQTTNGSIDLNFLQ